MVRAIAKSLDMVVSFIIGYASDASRSRFGRRLPYILVGTLFAPFAMWYLAAPPPEWNLNIGAAEGTPDESGGYKPYGEVRPSEANEPRSCGRRR